MVEAGAGWCQPVPAAAPPLREHQVECGRQGPWVWVWALQAEPTGSGRSHPLHLRHGLSSLGNPGSGLAWQPCLQTDDSRACSPDALWEAGFQGEGFQNQIGSPEWRRRKEKEQAWPGPDLLKAELLPVARPFNPSVPRCLHL